MNALPFRIDCYGVRVECETAAEAVALANLLGDAIRAPEHAHRWIADRTRYFKRCRCGLARRVNPRWKRKPVTGRPGERPAP